MPRSLFLGLILLLLSFTSCGGPTEADEPGRWDGDWGSTLDSGAVYLLEARDVNIVASTDQGLYVSLDQGEYFERANLPGLDGATITGIVLRTDRWFVVSNQGRLWESESFGYDWKHVGTLPAQTNVRLSASGQDLIAALGTGGVYRSTDYGRTWALSDSGITAQEVRTVFYHSALLLAAPILQPVLYRSTDFGETWSAVDSGYDATAVLDFTAVGQNIFAAAGDKGVYHSTNKGISWQSQVSGLPERQYAQTLHADKMVTYLGGTFSNLDHSDAHSLYRTLDYGATWEVSDDGLHDAIEEVTSVSATGNYIVVGTSNKGIWRRKKG